MITVQFMKPFYTKISEGKIRIVFAYQYFSIIKDEEVYHFIPLEGKEMIVDVNTMQIENVSEVFVFQRGNRFIRLPLHQLMLVSDAHKHVQTIVENTNMYEVSETDDTDYQETEPEVVELLEIVTQMNFEYAIDKSLQDRDEVMFYRLIEMQNE